MSAAEGLQRGIVIVPTYNEVENLPILVAKIRQAVPELDLLIVDDNSPDGTGKLADDLAQQSDGRMFVLHRPQKQGLGRAYVHAFTHVLATMSYDFIVHMDADLSHDPQAIPAMVAQIADADVVLGSRYCNGINVVGWDFTRLLLSKFATAYVKAITGLPLSDATSGFRCWRTSALRNLGLEQLSAQGYLILVEMAYGAYRRGMQISETPIIFYERRAGASKVSFAVMRESAFGVLKLSLRYWLQERQRAFAVRRREVGA